MLRAEQSEPIMLEAFRNLTKGFDYASILAKILFVACLCIIIVTLARALGSFSLKNTTIVPILILNIGILGTAMYVTACKAMKIISLPGDSTNHITDLVANAIAPVSIGFGVLILVTILTVNLIYKNDLIFGRYDRQDFIIKSFLICLYFEVSFFAFHYIDIFSQSAVWIHVMISAIVFSARVIVLGISHYVIVH